ncbi:MAG: hypothetical protein IH803_09300, partial [Nitrospirae bacterium]|nr:hypothetical protein [Nitrospirota bacterium]
MQPILTHDKSLPGKITEGTEAKHILDQETVLLGSQLVTQFHILLKTVRIHDRSNAALGHVLDALLTILKTLTHGHPAVLRLQNDFLYLNDRHLKLNPQLITIFMEFIDSLNARGIGEIRFSDELRVDDLREFSYLFIELDPESSTLSDFKQQLKEREIRGIDVEEATSFSVRVGDKAKQPKAVAKNLYLKAVTTVGAAMKNIADGKAPSLRESKRVIQNIVDLIQQDEPMILGLTTLRCYDEYTHNHSVNVSLLSLALGTRVGFPKAALVDLGLAGLYHDMGKTSVPLEILNKTE